MINLKIKNQDFTLLSDDILKSLDNLRERKVIKLILTPDQDPETTPSGGLSKEVSHVLFWKDCSKIPLGFEDSKVFNEVMGFNTKFLGAMIFDSDGSISLYKNIGGILYSIFNEKNRVKVEQSPTNS